MRTISANDLSHLNISPDEIRYASSDPCGEHKILYLTTDSRTVSDPGMTAFAAVRTGVNDGHRYIPELFGKGVKVFIVEHLPEELRALDATFIVVASVEEALHRIAYARIRGNENGIIVTGSHGKTKRSEEHTSELQSPR